MAEILPLNIVAQPAELAEAVQAIRAEDEPHAFMCELGGGLLRFANAAFPGAGEAKVFAQPNEREPEGRGAHFDVYADFIEEAYPWIGIFNLVGRATVKTTVLAPGLADNYFASFPDPTDEAFEARRHYSSIALAASNAKVYEGIFQAGTGLVLPQRKQGPHIVHDVIPNDGTVPGGYIKLVVPSTTEEAQSRMKSGGYKPLDELVTKAAAGLVTDATSSRARVPRRTVPSRSTRRNCNLD